MEFVIRWGGRVLDALVGLIFLCIIIITVIQVALRYLFGGALPWSEEFNLLLWVWLIQLGAIKTVHPRITLISTYLPFSAQRVLSVFLAAVTVALLGLLTWGAIRLMELTGGDYYSSMPWLSVSYSYLALVVASPLWMLAIIRDAVVPPGHETLAGAQ